MQLMQQNAAKDDEDSGSESESESEEESDVGQEESYQVKQEEGTGDGGLESDEESTPPFKSVKPERSLSPALSKQIPAPTSRITQLNRTSSTPLPLPPASFQALSLSPSLISTLKSIRISSPTEIQRACIPPILQGRDCVGGAKTGSGKTMAFALPILQRIARDPFGIWAVVLTPTR
jgi:ATP-dependent RNA helicase DDX49/DBP8